MQRKYQHLFFDLDRTLWDYDANAKETLCDIYEKYNLASKGVELDKFLHDFTRFNNILWAQFRHGEIKKEYLKVRRFYITLKSNQIKDNDLAQSASDDYLSISPEKTRLIPGAIELLEYLQGKYHMHIITNGFTEVQFKKLRNCNLEKYFERIITSDMVKSNKPKKEIFHYALSGANAQKTTSLMIGDDWDIDIMGAKYFGFDQVYFNRDGKNLKGQATYEIHTLNELTNILK